MAFTPELQDVVALAMKLCFGAMVIELTLLAFAVPWSWRVAPTLWTVEFEGEPSAVERLQEEALEQRVNEPSIWRRLDFDRLSGHEIAFDESRSRWTLRWGCTLSGLIHQDAATGQVTVSAKSSWSVPLLGLLLALQSLLQGEWPWVIVGCVAVGVLLTMRSARFDELTRALREMACRKA